jgi:hypothetical protein
LTKLRPFILTCDARLDVFKKFVKSYLTIKDSLLSPIVLVGYKNPEVRKEYDSLIEQLEPHVVIEQTNHFKDVDTRELIRKVPIGTHRHEAFINIQRIMIKDFPEIAVKYSNPEENIIYMEDDVIFSSKFPEAVKEVSEHLQDKCDFITLYSPTLRGTNSYDTSRKITANGYTTKNGVPSYDFVHAIDGNHFYGTPCVSFNRKVLEQIKGEWGWADTLGRVWDHKWGQYMNRKGYRMYATRKSYVQHLAGYSNIERRSRSLQSKIFVS